MTTNPNPDRPASVPPPMSRAAKAEALLLRFAAEAHRRKWSYDRGLGGDGVPVKSEAFDALHRLGEEMRVALEELRRTPAAVSVVPPATNQTALRDQIAAAIWERQNPGRRYADCEYRWQADAEADADAVLAALPAPVDRAAVSAALWTAAEHHTVAEWICCDPIDPTHALCVQGGVALRMLKALLVDDPEAWKPAPLLDEVMRLASAASSAAEAPQPETPDDDPLRMAEELCPGFPDRCPNLRTVEPEPGVHLGGVRCGCADTPPAVVAQPGKETGHG